MGGLLQLPSTTRLLLGFAPTLYLRPFFDVPDHPVYLLLHGAVLTVWFVWFFAQDIWVAIGRSDIHRKLGVDGVGMRSRSSPPVPSPRSV